MSSSSIDEEAQTKNEETKDPTGTCCFGWMSKENGVKILAMLSVVGALLNIFQSGFHAIAAVLIGAAAAWGIYYKNDYALMAWEVIILVDLVVAIFNASDNDIALLFIAGLAINIYFVYVIDEWRRNFDDEPEEEK